MKRRLKNIFAFVLAFAITVTSFISMSSTTKVHADSSAKERVETFVGLAAGKMPTNTEVLSSLKTSELRFLGIYLSNFFVPFATELGSANVDLVTEQKAAMVQALSNKLNFNSTVAETLVETVFGLSRSNNQELVFRVSKEYQPSDNKDYVTLKDFDLNYYTFVNLMTGGMFDSNKYDGTIDVPFLWFNIEQKTNRYNPSYFISDNWTEVNDFNYGYFGYMKDGTFIPVFDCSFNGTITASMEAFSQCFNSVDWENGYGLNFFDFTSAEVGDKYEDVYESLEDVSSDDAYKMSAYGTKIRVDCFGNIISMGANHQYVIVPGCMNPYTWVGVDESGKDSHKPGELYQVISFQGMSLAGSDLLFDRNIECNGNRGNDVDIYYEVPRSNIEFILSLNSNLEVISLEGLTLGAIDMIKGVDFTSGVPWRLIRGSSDYKIDDSIWYGSKGIDFMKKVEESIPTSTGKWYWLSWDGGFKDCSKTNLNNSILLSMPRPSISSVGHISRMMVIDNLGAFGFDSSTTDIEYNALQPMNFLDANGNAASNYFCEWSADSQNGFINKFQNMQSGTITTTVSASGEAIVSLYTTYAIAGLYQDSAKAETIGLLGVRINRDNLPSIANDPILLPSSLADKTILDAIRNWIYYLLHPSEGGEYIKVLIKGKLDAILLGWHDDMVGTTGTGITTGTTYFRTNYGYVTTPDLSEIQWTNSLINFYNSLIPYLILGMTISMLLGFVTGVMSFQKSVIGLLIFSAFLFVPVNSLNFVVGTTNRLTSNIYGEKFTYWAVIQEETYGSGLDTYASGDNYENYLRYLYSSNEANQGGESIVLKWQAPKKMASLMLSKRDTNLINGLQSGLINSTILNNGAYSGEAYLNGSSQYLYRDYSDIANFSRFIYHSLKNRTRTVNNVVTIDDIPTTHPDLRSAVDNMYNNDVYRQYVRDGYTNGSENYKDAIRLTAPLTSDIYRDAIETQSQPGYLQSLTTDNYVGLTQDLFNFSIAIFNNNSEEMKDAIERLAKDKNSVRKYTDGSYLESDFTALASYALMSESPFYYYSWKLYDDGMSTSSNAYNGYKSLLLEDTKGEYFYNNFLNGELKDFMDMRSLFTYIIPYLKMGNDVVREWDSIYGIYTHEGMYTEEGHRTDNDISSNVVLRNKYWHNLNVARLYEIYTPWVDLMYDCSYAKPQYISVLGEKYYISDPINPASYPAERPMIFSESEMYSYGLSEADLTNVERLILKCNRGMQERMYELLNYYNCSDLALNTAAAISCTFEFNTTFSESGLFKNNINLYPQSFEIKDFSYDAFLRFILSNNTGTSMTGTKDFYQELVEKSSTLTAIMLLVSDILGQYIVPAFKIFFLIALFISSILLILVYACKIDPEMKFVSSLSKQLFIPLVKFFAITMGFAWVVSLFMGVGNNAVTQSQTMSIQMGDPNMTMIAMCVVNIACIILYFNVIKDVTANISKNFRLAVNFEAGIIGGAVSGVTSMLSTAIHGTPYSGGSGSGDSVGETGTGRESGRASLRASNSDIKSLSDDESYLESNARISQTKRETAKFGSDKEADEKRRDSINESIKSGSEKIGKKSSNSEQKSKEES